MPVLINAKHEKFVQCLVMGMSQRKAYREAFTASKRWKDGTVDNKASKLFKADEIMARYQELQEESQDAAIMTRKERMVALSDIAREGEKESDMIKAIDTLNKMDNLYINRTELSGSVDVGTASDKLRDELRKRRERDG